jgi:hypothetical protein
MPPAPTEMSPQGTDIVPVGHYPHSPMPTPYHGNKHEDPNFLMTDPPPGSTTRQLELIQTLNTGNEEEGSSSVQTDPEPITWGTYSPNPSPVGSWGNPNYQPPSHPRYLSRQYSICDKLMGTLNPFKTLTCHTCQQWVEKSIGITQENVTKHVNAGKDDEEEFLFQGIPIAGENEGDSDDSWASEIFRRSDDNRDSEKGGDAPDSDHSYNQMATNYIAFTVGPVKDGIVKCHSLSPIPLTPNYYRHLPQIIECLPGSLDTYRWSAGCTSRTALTNSQR